jgi:N-acetyl-gamma-glutamyl-phosphate reductase
MNVGILGATGYTGIELIRILSKHPKAKIVYLSSKNFESKLISEVYPGIQGYNDLFLEEVDLKKVVKNCDVIFNTLPPDFSFEIAGMIKDNGKRLIDLGAAFRFDTFDNFKRWYNFKEDLEYNEYQRVYGLTELHKDLIKESKIIGNPGCYPTSIILGLAPLFKNDLIEKNSIVVDSKSGVSGAGHDPKYNNLYAECNENIKPYNVTKHRHIPEIEQELSKIANSQVNLIFTPHLVPMTRGILSTIYCQLKSINNVLRIYNLYKEFYQNDYFIKICEPGTYPSTKNVYGSNYCHIGFEIEERTNTLIVMSVIDNLVKGASGQAIQNMNLMFGLPENKGLDLVPIYP